MKIAAREEGVESNVSVKKVVLAYSGGLDTSIIIPWIKQNYGWAEIVGYCGDVGQGEDLEAVRRKALATGASECVVEDLRESFVRDYCFEALKAGAVYEDSYLLGTSLARPILALGQVRAALACGADALAHGATGKGNDQIRFEVTYMALDPSLKIIAPWKDPRFELRSREAAVEYAQARKIPVDASKKKIYSRDRNLWHISHEGAEIEDPANEPLDRCLVMTVPVTKAPDKPAYVEVTFEKGVPVQVDGKKLAGHEIIATLNTLGGKHAVGQTVLVENRLVGMKSRGVYETPGGTILYEAHKALEQTCLERDLYHYKQQLAVRYAELVYYGQWFHPLREAMQAFVDHANQVVSGTVRVKLYKGRAQAVSVRSRTSLYDLELASFAMDGYDVTAARGFIDLFGLPMKVRGIRQKPRHT